MSANCYNELDLQGALGVQGQIPFKNALGAHTNSDRTLSQIDYWRQQCSTSHSQCPPVKNSSEMPTRLLDVSEPSKVRLIETNGQQGQYVCRTHRWGQSEMPIRTTTGTLDQMKKGLSLDSLPATFRDAANITPRLGAKHIWIDSLCIIQDDHADWEREAAKMASVYKNGLMTIAAAWAEGPTEGLFARASEIIGNDSQPLELSTYELPFQIKVRQQLRYDVGHLHQTQEHGILERGWILQERLLSPRIIYFGFNEVAWECMAGSACECEPILTSYRATRYSPREPFNPKTAFSLSTYSSERDHDHRSTANTPSPELWHHIVNSYTGLDFTVIDNKFPALAGLGSDIARTRPNDQYIAGLWRSTFMMDLLWRKRKSGDWQATAFGEHYDLHNVYDNIEVGKKEFMRKLLHQGDRDREIRKQGGDRFAPSWSWASMNIQVEYETDLNSLDVGLLDPELAKLVHVNCNHVYGMGMLLNAESASVTIRGKVVAVDLRTIRSMPGELRLYKDDHSMGFSEGDQRPSPGFDAALRGIRKLHCLLIASGRVKKRPMMSRIYGLVLAEVDSDQPGRQLFERVGMFEETFRAGKEWYVFDKVQDVTDVTIV